MPATGLAAVAAAVLCAATPARAGTFPTPTGESGILRVPDAGALELGRASFSLDLRHASRGDGALRPSPAAVIAGLGGGLEVGVSLREGGRPGDPEPARLLLGGAAKLRLREATGRAPAAAVAVVLDRVNWEAVAGARFVASTDAERRVRVAAFAGADAPRGALRDAEATAGAAVAVRLGPVELALDGSRGAGGGTLGGGVAWTAFPGGALRLGVGWLPAQRAAQITLGVAVATPPRRERVSTPEADEEAEAAATPAVPAATHASEDGPPRGRLVLRRAVTPPTPLRHHPGALHGREPAASPEPVPGPGVKPPPAPAEGAP